MTYYKHDIEYITKYFTPGTEAVRVDPKLKPEKEKTLLPKVQERPRRKVYVDPLALCAVTVATVLTLMLVLTMFRFADTYRNCEQVKSTLTAIEDKNVLLTHEYHASYDLAEVEKKALALGMIPISQAQTETVTVTIPEPAKQPTLWEDICWFFEGLFA